jgi:hypothetical protein
MQPWHRVGLMYTFSQISYKVDITILPDRLSYLHHYDRLARPVLLVYFFT